MPRRRRLSVFSLSFLDVMSCGFGAVVLVFLIINHDTQKDQQVNNNELLAEIRMLDYQVQQGEKDMFELIETLDRPEHPNLSWVYFPQEKQGPANRITYMSNYSDGNAPEGKTSFLCEVTNPPDQRAPSSIVDDVVAGMERAGLVRKDEILFTDTSWHRFAYIVYDHELESRRETSIRWCEDEGILPLGRFGHYDYFNSDQCVIAAREAAGRLLARAVRG